MIKADSVIDKNEECRTILKIHVVTNINDDLKDIGGEVIKSELVSIFKHLHTIDPEIILDALEIYKEDLENEQN